MAGRSTISQDGLDPPDPDVQEAYEDLSSSPEPSTPLEVADRLVHLLWTRLDPRASNGGQPDGEDDDGSAALHALGELLADPDDEAAQAALAHQIDDQAKDPDLRVDIERLVRQAWDARLAATRDGPVGICISGGGVRSASFGLGALQALQDRERLVYGPTRAEYLAAVSGGSYIAGAVTMLASRYGSDDALPHAELAHPRYPFAPSTPEVEHLRRRARYLVGGGVVETILQFLLRLSLNLLYLAVVIFIVARPAGWLYGLSITDLARADQLTAAELEVEPLIVPTVLGAVFGVAGVFVVFLTTIKRSMFNVKPYRMLRYGLLGVGALLLLVGFALPVWLEWLAEQWYVEPVTGSVPVEPGQGPNDVVQGVPEAAVPWAFWSTFASVTAALASFKAIIPDEVGKTLFSRRFRPWLLRLLRLLIALAALTAIPIVVLTFASTTMIGGALGTTSWLREAVLMCIALAGLLVIAWLRDPTIWSLHPFYKSRLMACYNVMRDPGSRLGARRRPSEPRYLLSQSSPPELPTLLVCAAANVSGFGNAPAGHNVLPFVLSPREIGFTDGQGVVFPTRDLERAVKGKREDRNITLPAAIAITGAAFSPSMGKMTISQIRMLMAVLNLRLGIWLPNPRNDDVRNAVTQKRGLPVRPMPWYLLKEALGFNHPGSRLIYVSDGGHYENLGLVELLRKGCRRIWCIDASGDRPGQTSTLAEAMLLAESELGVRWTGSRQLDRLHLDKRGSDGREGLTTVLGTHVTLSYELPDETTGTVTVVKTGVTSHTPDHLADYQRRHPSFPYDSTVNQLFRADRFDAYVSLGYHSTQAALEEELEEEAGLEEDAADATGIRKIQPADMPGTDPVDISQTTNSEM